MINDNWETKPQKVKAVRITQEFLENRSEWPKWFKRLAGNKGHNKNSFALLQGMEILGRLFPERGANIAVFPGDWIVKRRSDGRAYYEKEFGSDFTDKYKQTTDK